MRKAKLMTILYYSYPSCVLLIACGGTILFLFSKADFHWNSSQYIHDWLQNCFKLAFLSQNKPNLKPSWLQIDSSWSHVGPKLSPSWLKLNPWWPQVASNLLQVGPMLDPDPGPQPPLSQPKPFETFFCGLLASHVFICVLRDPT